MQFVNYFSSICTKSKSCLILLFCIGLLFSSCSDNPGSPNEPEPEPTPEPEPEVTVGSLEITTVTTGQDPDPRGYTVVYGDSQNINVGPNETATEGDLDEGTYTVELTNIKEHCVVESENPVSVDIVADQTSSVSFEVECKGIFRNKIVFFRTQSQAKSANAAATQSYFSMNPDGSDLQKAADLTLDGRLHYKADISPDGTKMVVSYAEYINGSYSNYRLATIDAYGSQLNYLVDRSESLNYFDPVFSPDGSQIAFTVSSSTGKLKHIQVINADGSNQRNVTNSENLDGIPSWSPDGKQLVFERASNNYEYLGIYVANVDGSGVKRISKTEREFSGPRWSPGGNKIAVVGSQEDPFYYQQVYMMNSDGSNAELITGKKGQSIYYSTPIWSPDGNQIIFASNRDGTPDEQYGYAYEPNDIFIVNKDGSNLMNLTNTMNVGESGLMWSPVIE